MNPVYRKNHLVFYQRSTHVGNAARTPSDGLTISSVLDPDLVPERFCHDASIRIQWNARFQEGHNAVVAALNGTPAHLSWVAIRRLYISELDFHWTLGTDEACIYDCTTLPEFRGKGLYQSVLRWIALNRAADRNPAIVWIYSDSRNKSSISGIQKAGFNEVGSAKASYLFGHRISLSTPFETRE